MQDPNQPQFYHQNPASRSLDASPACSEDQEAIQIALHHPKQLHSETLQFIQDTYAELSKEAEEPKPDPFLAMAQASNFLLANQTEQSMKKGIFDSYLAQESPNITSQNYDTGLADEFLGISAVESPAPVNRNQLPQSTTLEY